MIRTTTYCAALAFLLMGMGNTASAQTADAGLVEMARPYYTKIKAKGYEQFKNVDFATVFNSATTIYSLRSFPIFTSKTLQEYVPSPTFSKVAVIDGNHLRMVSLESKDAPILEVGSVKKYVPKKLAYTSDERYLNVVDAGNGVHVLTTDGYKEVRSFKLESPAREVMVSANGYHFVETAEKSVTVYNYEAGTVRASLNLPATVNAVSFSRDCSQMAVACANGSVVVYSTATFEPVITVTGLGEARDVSFHREGKYIAVVEDDSHIDLVNLLDQKDRFRQEYAGGGVSQVRFLTQTGGRDLIFTKRGTDGERDAQFVYLPVTDLLPYYTNMVIDELNSRLDEWSRMLPGETTEEYRARVNDHTRAAEAKRLEQEIATRLAGDMVSLAAVRVQGYDRDSEMLTISFDNLPDVYLKMDEAEAAYFVNPEELVFGDVVYGLTADDKFEIIYATVYNKKSGKTYTFDNLSRESLNFLKGEDSFVPIELVQQVGMEDVVLQNFKDEVLTQAKQDNLISDHTHISVNASAEPAVDADGRRITNYNIDFNYQVEAEYSAKDDFAPGRYRIEQSNAGVSMLTIAQKAFENDFAKYIREGKKLIITVSGAADGLPIRSKIAYDGCYGKFENMPYTLNNELKTMTVTPSTGITQNEQLAFLRAQGVKHYLDSHINGLQTMAVDYRTNVELSEGTGGEYRRIHVRFSFIDAF